MRRSRRRPRSSRRRGARGRRRSRSRYLPARIRRVWAKGATSIVSEADFAVDRLLAERLLGRAPRLWLAVGGDRRQRRPPRRAPRLRRRSDRRHPRLPRRAAANGRSRSPSSRRRGRSRPSCSRRRSARFRARLPAAGADRNGEPLCDERTQHARRRPLRRPAALCPRGRRGGGHRRAKSRASCRRSPIAWRWSRRGEIDVAIAGPNAHDWDIAAADLLVQEAGGVFGRPRRPEARATTAPRPPTRRWSPRHPALAGEVARA